MNVAAAGMPSLMAGLLLRTSVVLTLALLAALAAKRHPAAFRHLILAAALVGLLLLPPLTLSPIGWKSPLLPAWIATAAPQMRGGPARESRPWAVGAAFAEERRAESSGNVKRPGLGSSLQAVTTPDMIISSKRTVSLSPDASPPGPTLRQAGPMVLAERTPSNAAGYFLAALWVAGLAALLLRLVFGLAGAVRLTSQGTPLDSPPWQILLERFLTLVSLRRKVRLKSHPGVLVPLTWGWRRPIVLIPEGADDWTDEERSSALWHELSHIKRADFLIMLLVRTSLALFWWNPLCWIAYRELLKEQEIACDELVLRAGIRPSAYAASLLAFRRSAGFRWNPSAALLGMLRRSSFQERLAAILKQKLTLMEVKMKTKILLSLALILAIALVGTARPVAGGGIPEARTVLAETLLPAPAPFDSAFDGTAVVQAQSEKAAQEKEQEKAKTAEKAKVEEKTAKEKAAVQKTVVIKPVVVEGKPIEIVITEGDQVKKLLIDKPLTITKGKDGEAIVLTIEGQEAQVLEGEPLRLEIKGGEVMVLKEGKPVKIAEGQHLQVAKEIETEGGHLTYYFAPRAKAGQTFTLVKEGDAGKEGVEVVVEKHLEGEPTVVWTIKEHDKGENVWVGKSASGEPVQMTWVAKDGHAHAFSSTTDEEMLEKIRALQEQVQAIKAKKMDITALEESLKKLEAELRANEEELKQIRVEVAKEPHQYVVAKKAVGHEPGNQVTVWVTEKGHTVKPDEAKAVVRAAGDGDATINIILTGKTGDEGRKAYERALAELKKRLPEGYKLAGQSYDPENGTMVFGIAAAEGMKTDEGVVRKLVEALQAEIKK